MYTSRSNWNRGIIGQKITTDYYNFERGREYKHHETTITEDNNGSQERNNRIQAGNRCIFYLKYR